MTKHISTESVVELTRQGLSAKDISERLGVCTRTVHRHRVAAGIAQTAKHGGRYTPEFLAEASRLLDEGWSLVEIARTYNVSECHLGKHFRGRGWTKVQASELAVIRRAENRLFRVLDNQRRNARHLMPLAGELCQPQDAFEDRQRQSPTKACA